jgi:hypothetical protein
VRPCLEGCGSRSTVAGGRQLMAPQVKQTATPFRHPVSGRPISASNLVLAVPAHAQQDDLNWKATMPEGRHWSGCVTSRSGLYCRG